MKPRHLQTHHNKTYRHKNKMNWGKLHWKIPLNIHKAKEMRSRLISLSWLLTLLCWLLTSLCWRLTLLCWLLTLLCWRLCSQLWRRTGLQTSHLEVTSDLFRNLGQHKASQPGRRCLWNKQRSRISISLVTFQISVVGSFDYSLTDHWIMYAYISLCTW